MRIIPAVDIKDGRCVQLVGGKPGTEKFYGDPVEVACRWEEEGAEILHVIDLDAALGTGDNRGVVRDILDAVNIPIEFGGGIRDIGKARELLSSGIDRIILGTLAVNDYPGFKIINELGGDYSPDRLIVAVDSSCGYVLVRGWQEKTRLETTEFIGEIEDLVWGFLYTDVDVEGKMMGINIRNIKETVNSTDLPVIISGGITSEGDIDAIETTGAYAVVIGKALYEGKLDVNWGHKKR